MNRHFLGHAPRRAREALPGTDGVPRENQDPKHRSVLVLGTLGFPKGRERDGEEGNGDTVRASAWLRAWCRGSVWESRPQIGALEGFGEDPTKKTVLTKCPRHQSISAQAAEPLLGQPGCV